LGFSSLTAKDGEARMLLGVALRHLVDKNKYPMKIYMYLSNVDEWLIDF